MTRISIGRMIDPAQSAPAAASMAARSPAALSMAVAPINMVLATVLALALAAAAPAAHAQQHSPASYGPETRQFIIYDEPVIALTHVRVIDGTGGPAAEDRTVVIRDGRIEAVGPAATVRPPAGARVLERPGYTVFPGIVGMHDHLFDVPPREDFSNWTFLPAPLTAPRLYLAHGVTTIRTTGTVAFNIDLGVARAIDAGRTPGPRINVTSPLLVDSSAASSTQWGVRGPQDARRVVKFFAESGAESFKIYTQITRAEVAAIIDEAHRHDIKVTGHLCSLTHREAAGLGIDNIEHGFSFMTDFTPGKQPDVCPRGGPRKPVTGDDPEFQALVRFLVDKGVAITSTITLEEMFMRPERVTDEYLSYLTTDQRFRYLKRRARDESIFPGAPSGSPEQGTAAIRREVGRLRAFFDAGGLLMIGPDAIGPDLIKGYADLRGLELLVEGGFTPLEAFKVATLNGATFLGLADQIGSIEPGKQADLVLVKGNPAARIADIRNTEVVFRNGIGYDPQKLKDSVRGQMGLR